MATGIETAGLVLAVMPLLAFAIQNHKEAIRRGKALFQTRDHYRRGLQDLGVCLVQLENTLGDLLKIAGITSEVDVATLIEACKQQQKWHDQGKEAMLISHLGERTYHFAFRVTIERIQEDIVEILGILGLPSEDVTAISKDVSGPPRSLGATTEAHTRLGCLGKSQVCHPG